MCRPFKLVVCFVSRVRNLSYSEPLDVSAACVCVHALSVRLEQYLWTGFCTAEVVSFLYYFLYLFQRASGVWSVTPSFKVEEVALATSPKTEPAVLAASRSSPRSRSTTAGFSGKVSYGPSFFFHGAK